MRDGVAQPSDQVHWWRVLWKMKIPPKIRIFWWRVINNFMPSKAELKRRHVAKESFCEACGDPSESIYHVALECSYVRRFCEAVCDILGIKMPPLHPITWAKDIISEHRCSTSDANVIVCGVWSLWTGRNARAHGSSRQDPDAACPDLQAEYRLTVQQACPPRSIGQLNVVSNSSWINDFLVVVRHIAKMLDDLVCLDDKKEPRKPRVAEVWKSPDTGWAKVNTDGAFEAKTGKGAAGAILRNKRGETLAAEGRKYEHLADAVTAEALAARNGLLLAVAMGCNRVILELDNQTLANSLKATEHDRSSIADLWQEIQELGRSSLSFRISFVHQEANSAAHCCAKMPTVSESMWSTFGYAPDWLLGVVTKDFNSAMI
ncbi:hypothetical protein EJB05_02576, partial [Eragrostis curvula]